LYQAALISPHAEILVASNQEYIYPCRSKLRIHNLANSLHRIAFFTLAGVAEAHIDGDAIVGRWSDEPNEVRTGKMGALIVQFANWPDTPESVVKFTRKYGPLDARRSLKSDLTGSTFEFPASRWRGLQKQFCKEWRAYVQLGHGKHEAIEVAPGEHLVRQEIGLAFRAATLYRLLIFGLASIPGERLRVCSRPACSHPYFVARHLKQTYCSDACAQWGQRQWKLKWWAEHGTEWRDKRAAARRKKSSIAKEK
jgi:hypothetical protein